MTRRRTRHRGLKIFATIVLLLLTVVVAVPQERWPPNVQAHPVVAALYNGRAAFFAQVEERLPRLDETPPAAKAEAGYTQRERQKMDKLIDQTLDKGASP